MLFQIALHGQTVAQTISYLVAYRFGSDYLPASQSVSDLCDQAFAEQPFVYLSLPAKADCRVRQIWFKVPTTSGTK